MPDPEEYEEYGPPVDWNYRPKPNVNTEVPDYLEYGPPVPIAEDADIMESLQQAVAEESYPTLPTSGYSYKEPPSTLEQILATSTGAANVVSAGTAPVFGGAMSFLRGEGYDKGNKEVRDAMKYLASRDPEGADIGAALASVLPAARVGGTIGKAGMSLLPRVAAQAGAGAAIGGATEGVHALNVTGEDPIDAAKLGVIWGALGGAGGELAETGIKAGVKANTRRLAKRELAKLGATKSDIQKIDETFRATNGKDPLVAYVNQLREMAPTTDPEEAFDLLTRARDAAVAERKAITGQTTGVTKEAIRETRQWKPIDFTSIDPDSPYGREALDTLERIASESSEAHQRALAAGAVPKEEFMAAFEDILDRRIHKQAVTREELAAMKAAGNYLSQNADRLATKGYLTEDALESMQSDLWDVGAAHRNAIGSASSPMKSKWFDRARDMVNSTLHNVTLKVGDAIGDPELRAKYYAAKLKAFVANRGIEIASKGKAKADPVVMNRGIRIGTAIAASSPALAMNAARAALADVVGQKAMSFAAYGLMRRLVDLVESNEVLPGTMRRDLIKAGISSSLFVRSNINQAISAAERLLELEEENPQTFQSTAALMEVYDKAKPRFSVENPEAPLSEEERVYQMYQEMSDQERQEELNLMSTEEIKALLEIVERIEAEESQ